MNGILKKYLHLENELNDVISLLGGIHYESDNDDEKETLLQRKFELEYELRKLVNNKTLRKSLEENGLNFIELKD
jgi:hypothetical protein